jgi:hypothetical protein
MKAFITKALFSKILLISAIIFCIAFSAQAQTAAKPATTKTATTKSPALVSSYIETFFKKYKTSSDSAIDYLFSTNKLFTNYAQINLLKSKLDSLELNLGKYEGRELISQKSAGTSLVIYSYLVKHENQPVRFIFMFYRPKDQWELYRFNYDDSMDTELIEAAKINNKK